MDKILLHEYRIPVKGVKRKTIYHFSDTHLAEYDSLSPEKEIEAAKKATDAWIRVRKAFADGHGEPFGEAQMLPAREHFVNLMNASRDGDVLVIAGDMLDFVNGANVRLAEKELKDYPCPVLALCGNHENANNIPEGMTISMMREPIQIAELDDDEKAEFLEDLGLSESGLEKLIAASYHILGLQSYLTSEKRSLWRCIFR